VNRRRFLALMGSVVGAAGVAGAGFYSWFRHHEQDRETLVMGGSSIVDRFIKKVLPGFYKHHHQIDVLVEGGGSSGGLIALERGGIDLAMMSRELTPDENRLNIHSYLIGIESIAIVVHASNRIEGISLEQVRKIFDGSIDNWKELGGPDRAMNAYGRKEGSTTRLTLDQLVMQSAPFNRKVKELESSEVMLATVSDDPFAVGFLTNRHLNDKVKALKVNGIEISEESILLHRYPLTRDLFLVYKDPEKDIARNFINYVLSNESQITLADSGLTRVR